MPCLNPMYSHHHQYAAIHVQVCIPCAILSLSLSFSGSTCGRNCTRQHYHPTPFLLSLAGRVEAETRERERDKIYRICRQLNILYAFFLAVGRTQTLHQPGWRCACVALCTGTFVDCMWPHLVMTTKTTTTTARIQPHCFHTKRQWWHQTKHAYHARKV